MRFEVRALAGNLPLHRIAQRLAVPNARFEALDLIGNRMLVGRRLVKLRQVVVDADRFGAVRQRLGQSFPRARRFAPGEGRPAFDILHAFATYPQGGGLLREIARLLATLAALSLHRLQIGDGARARGTEDRR